MSDTPTRQKPRELTAVDDVRKIRAEFQKDSGGDLRKHVEQSNRVLEEYRQRLGLKVIQPPPRKTPEDGTGS